MKAISILSLVAVAVSGWTQTVRLVGSGGYGIDSPYNRLYNRSRQITFTGRVVGKTIAAPLSGMAESIALTVKSRNGGTSQVELGPRWYVANQAAKINIGDSVKVIGSKVRLGQNDNVILARQVVDPRNRVLTLRDLSGVPYWTYSRNSGFVADLGPNTMSGTIVRNETYVLDGVTYGGYVVDTGNGNINIFAAPDWYLSRQDFSFQPGNYITVLGQRRPVQVAPNTYVADTIYGNGVTLVLSNNGVPVYQNFGGGN